MKTMANILQMPFWFRSNEKLLERVRAAKDKADKLRNEIWTVSLEIAYKKKVNIKIFLLE